tara:strand:- start:153 stop:281 length:129 start_codon:yes stop_codon:yes gene_type:complete
MNKIISIIILGLMVFFSTTSCKNIKKAPPEFKGPDKIVIKVL